MNSTQITSMFSRLQALNPHPTSELFYRSDFELLIAVMLSAHTTDRSVNNVTPTLFALANTPQQLYALGEAELQNHIRTIGLYRTKARHIIATCYRLIHTFNHQIPNTREGLESLPGVGRKTANVILNMVFKIPTIAIDTHIFRVSNRTGLAIGKTPLAVEQQLMDRIPPQFCQDAHHWLILHGRYVCTARHPKCSQCVIRDVCEYTNK